MRSDKEIKDGNTVQFRGASYQSEVAPHGNDGMLGLNSLIAIGDDIGNRTNLVTTFSRGPGN
jgi:hypothetical protein